MTRHIHIDLRGALCNWSPNRWQNVCRDTETGDFLKPKQVKALFEEMVNRGETVMPVCSPMDCPDFDYRGGGCPGHEEKEAVMDSLETLAVRLVANNGHGLMSRNGCFLRMAERTDAHTEDELARIEAAIDNAILGNRLEERRPSGGGGQWLYITAKGRESLPPVSH